MGICLENDSWNRFNWRSVQGVGLPGLAARLQDIALPGRMFWAPIVVVVVEGEARRVWECGSMGVWECKSGRACGRPADRPRSRSRPRIAAGAEEDFCSAEVIAPPELGVRLQGFTFPGPVLSRGIFFVIMEGLCRRRAGQTPEGCDRIKPTA